MKRLIILFSFLFTFAFAQEKPLIKAAGSPRVHKDQAEFIVEGLTLVPGGTEIKDVPREKGIHVIFSEDEALKDDPELVEVLSPFLNQALNEAYIAKVKKEIVEYFREKQGLYVAAIVPVQRVQNHVIILQILEGHIGSIEYKGQKWFSETVIKNALGIQPGEPLDEEEFLNDVTWSNRNPFRSTKMVLVPGHKQGTTNLLFMTEDRFPLRLYVGADNTGFKSNNVYRVFAGFNWGNAFRVGDILSYQYTAAPNFHDFQSHVANYTSFLPWQHILSVYGTYGVVYPDIPDFQIEGKNLQGSFRYQIPFRPLYGLFRHHFEFGWDYKYLTSSLFFVGDVDSVLVTPSQTIAITEFMTSYKFERNWTQNLLTFRLDMYLSPWKNWIFPHQTAREYNQSRPNSVVRFAFWRGVFSNTYRTKNRYTFKGMFRGQLATGAIPVAEQFGLGGYNTVRGYYEQQVVADDAAVVNFEAYTPEISFFKIKDAFSFLVFADYGFGYNYKILAPEFRRLNLLGAGAGLRYDIQPYFTSRLDYGVQILHLEQLKRPGRFHFSLIANY